MKHRVAINRDTGEKVILIDDEWQPFDKVAFNRDTNESVGFYNNEWLPLNKPPDFFNKRDTIPPVEQPTTTPEQPVQYTEPIQAKRPTGREIDTTTLTRDTLTARDHEEVSGQLREEFDWLTSPPKISDPTAQKMVEEMVGIWRSSMEPARKLELLRRWQKATAHEAAPKEKQDTIFGETTLGDTARTLTHAGAGIAAMGTAATRGILDLVPFVPDSAVEWVKSYEDDFLLVQSELIDEIKDQGGTFAAAAQETGSQLLTTAVRLMMLKGLSGADKATAVTSAMRFGGITFVTTPGTKTERLKAAVRAMVLMSTGAGAKKITTLLKVTGKLKPIITTTLDAFANFGLGNLLNKELYDYSSPEKWFPAVATDFLFAFGTGMEVARAQGDTAKVAELQAKKNIIDAQKKAYEDAVGKDKADQAFRDAEATRTERMSDTEARELTKEEATSILQDEISKMLPVEPAPIVKPSVEPKVEPKAEIKIEPVKEPAPKAEPKVAEQPSRTAYEQRLIDVGYDSKEAKSTVDLLMKDADVKTEADMSKIEDGVKDIEYADAQAKEFKAEGRQRVADVSQRARKDATLRQEEMVKRGAEQPKQPKPEVKEVKPEPKIPTTPEQVKQQYSEPETPMPHGRLKEATRVAQEASKLKDTNMPKAVEKAIQAQKIIERPYEPIELNNMTDKELAKVAKKRNLNLDSLPKTPSRIEVIGAIKDAQNRESQQELTGETQPIKNLSAKQAAINKALGVKKPPKTPEEREAYMRKLGVAEGTLAGQIAGVKEGIRKGRIESKKLAQAGMKAIKERSKIYQDSLRQMSKGLGLTKDEQNEFAKRIAEVTTGKKYNKLADEIEGRAETVVKRRAVNEIKADLSDFRKGKMIPAIMETIKEDIAETLGYKGEWDRLKDIRESTENILNRHGIKDLPEKPSELSKMLTEKMKDMNLDDVEALRNNFKMLKDASTDAVKEHNKNIEKERKSNAEEAVNSVNKAKRIGFLFGIKPPDDVSPERRSVSQRTTAGLASWAREWNVNLDTKVWILDGGKRNGPVARILYDAFLKATPKLDKIIIKGGNSLAEIRKITPIGWSRKKADVTVNGRPIKITHGRKIAMLLSSLDEASRKDMITDGVQTEGMKNKVIFSEEDIKRLWESASTEELAAVNLMRDGIDNNITPESAKAYKAKHGYNMPGLRDNYFQSFRMKDSAEGLSKDSVVRVDGAGWLKHKGKSGDPLDIRDAFETYAKLTSQVAKYAAFSKPISDARALLNDKDFRATVREKFGEKFLGEIEKHIDRIEGIKWQTGWWHQKLLNMLTSVQSSFINLNPPTWFKQLPSLTYAWVEGIPMVHLENNLFTKVNYKEMFDASPLLERRWAENLFERETKLQYKEKGFRGAVRRIASIPLRASDRWAIGTIWNGTKDYYAKDEGLTGKELIDTTARRVESLVARTQPTADALNQTLLQSEKDLPSRGASLFSSQRSKMIQMILKPVISRINADTKAEKSDANMQMGKAFLVFGMSSGIAMAGIDVARRKIYDKLNAMIAKKLNPDIGEVKDPVKVKDQMAEGALRSLVGMVPTGREVWTIGAALSTGKNLSEVLRSGRLDGALNSAAGDIVKAVDSWRGDDDITEQILNTLIMSDRFLGIGYSSPARIALNASNAVEKIKYIQDGGVRTMIARHINGEIDRNEVREYIKFIVPNDKKRQLKYINKLNSAIKAEKKKSVEK